MNSSAMQHMNLSRCQTLVPRSPVGRRATGANSASNSSMVTVNGLLGDVVQSVGISRTIELWRG